MHTNSNSMQEVTDILETELVIYTAIADRYDFLRDLPKVFSGVESICFSDGGRYGKRGQWDVRPFPSKISDPTRRCRDVKINAHKYITKKPYSLWIDGNIRLHPPAVDLLRQLVKNKTAFASFNHPYRDCVYQEAIACIDQGRDDSEIIRAQMAALRDLGMPESSGLLETNVLFRCHVCPRVAKALDAWSKMLEGYSKRDQLSVKFALLYAELVPEIIPGSARGGSPAFSMGEHRKEGIYNLPILFEAQWGHTQAYRYLRQCLKSLRIL